MNAALIGHNSSAFFEDDDAPTADEARIVFAAISYLKFKLPDLGDFLEKRKGGRKLGWRLVIVNVLKDRVRQNSVRKLLNLNRKTCGENAQRPDCWADHDDEFGDGIFGDLLARFREAVHADACVDMPALDEKVRSYAKIDPDLRKLEKQRKAHEEAALEAERAADAIERAAEARRVAKRQGAPYIARTASDAAIAFAAELIRLDVKGARKNRSAFDTDKHRDGFAECEALGLTAESVPHLAPRPADPPILPTDLCRRVFVEAEKLGRIGKKKKTKRK